MAIKMMISKITICWAAYLIISPFFMRKALNFILSHIGVNGLALMLWGIILSAGYVMLISLRRSKPTISRTLFFFGIFAAGLLYASQVNIIEERMHLINFGLLGWLTIRDIGRFRNNIQGVALSLIICILVASIEETFQLWIPGRVAEIRDALLGVVGGAWGISLFLSSRSPLPKPLK